MSAKETAMTAEGALMAAPAGKYLTFRLGGEEYGLPILAVREIIALMPVTRVPGTPEFVRGVINLRGKVLPVVDLRRRFGLPPGEDSPRTCIVVVEVQRDGHAVPLGAVVDEVCEVHDFTPEQLEATPGFGARVETEFILGIGKIGQAVVVLLEINRVLSTDELVLVGEVGR